MTKPHWVLGYFLAGAAILTLHGAPALAGEAAPSRAMHDDSRGFDWIEHTQHTLDELKVKLNLSPGQTAAWKTFSTGVISDARQQLEQKEGFREERAENAKAPADDPTPEQMARGIEHLRAHIAWMQQHLTQLEAAQARAKAFYDVLDTNQKTIFDLFWHEMYHRMAGHDSWHMGMHGDFGRGPMMHGDEDAPDSITEPH